MARWLPTVLARIRELASRGRVRFTDKALWGLTQLRIDLDQDDVCEILCSLETGESAGRVVSEHSGEWMYVFKPELAGTVVYVKLILRSDCVLISFHEDLGSYE